MLKYKLRFEEVTNITTDNASNFAKAFREYAKPVNDYEESDDSSAGTSSENYAEKRHEGSESEDEIRFVPIDLKLQQQADDSMGQGAVAGTGNNSENDPDESDAEVFFYRVKNVVQRTHLIS